MPEVKLRHRPAKARALPDVGEGKVEAYISVFGVPYNVGYGSKEQVEVGAFDEGLAEKSKLPVFWMHSWDEGLLIGDADGTADEKGLKLDAQLYVDDDLGRRAWRGLSSGAIDEWSVAFMAEAWEIDPDDEMLEHVTKARAIEGSAVVLGANPATETIDVRRRELVLPLLEDGKLRWVPVEEIESADPDRRRRRSRKDEPREEERDDFSDIPPERLRLLERPAVRELYRERIGS